MAEKPFALSSLPSAKSPLGRHRKVDVLVNPSEKKEGKKCRCIFSTGKRFFLSFFRIVNSRYQKKKILLKYWEFAEEQRPPTTQK